jgi:hypothetical protein
VVGKKVDVAWCWAGIGHLATKSSWK